jgi:uncharacterized protein (TIGR02246 family)
MLRTTRTRLLVLVVAGMLPVFAAASPAAAFGLSAGPASDVEGEKEIRDLYVAFVADWNKHNPQALADRWAVDGDHLEPDGRVAKGRDEVRALFVKQHETVFAKTKLELELTSVWFISETVALADGAYSISGIVDPSGNPVGERKGHLTSVLLREQGTWWVAASRLMIPATLPYRP